MVRTIGAWTKTECEECGESFQITRIEPKIIEGIIVCYDCKAYEKAYDEGVSHAKQTILELRGQLENCVNHLHQAKRKLSNTDFDACIDSANRVLEKEV